MTTRTTACRVLDALSGQQRRAKRELGAWIALELRAFKALHAMVAAEKARQVVDSVPELIPDARGRCEVCGGVINISAIRCAAHMTRHGRTYFPASLMSPGTEVVQRAD